VQPQALVPVTREREIRPAGAEEDAAAFRAEADHLRQVAESLRGNIVRLGLTWAGRSADRFLDWFLPFPYRLDALAEGIDVQVGRIDQKTVTMFETIMVPPGGAQPG
jgi:uncharacterized protein YukE